MLGLLIAHAFAEGESNAWCYNSGDWALHPSVLVQGFCIRPGIFLLGMMQVNATKPAWKGTYESCVQCWGRARLLPEGIWMLICAPSPPIFKYFTNGHLSCLNAKRGISQAFQCLPIALVWQGLQDFPLVQLSEMFIANHIQTIRLRVPSCCTDGKDL